MFNQIVKLDLTPRMLMSSRSGAGGERYSRSEQASSMALGWRKGPESSIKDEKGSSPSRGGVGEVGTQGSEVSWSQATTWLCPVDTGEPAMVCMHRNVGIRMSEVRDSRCHSGDQSPPFPSATHRELKCLLQYFQLYKATG